jgi:isoquinoline 1-oxidoreductase beta subunit
LDDAARKLAAVYEVPFQAHATMEPMNCTAHVRADGADIWVPTQSQGVARTVAAEITGLAPETIQIHTTFLGGGFGRRAEQDFLAEAVQLSKATGVPVKVVWTREDDMTHDFYRPATYNVLHAGLGKDGLPVAWTHRIVGPSIMSRVRPEQIKNGIDPTSVEGAANLPYGIPNLRVDYIMHNPGIPVGFWRSVGSSQNAFVTEGFIDELAHAGKHDPFEFRRRLLAGSPRHKAVLELAAEKAGWGSPLPKGVGRGIAVAESFGTYVAEVAEVSVGRTGRVKVHRVVCAVDCGTAVNPDTVRAQMEGGIVYGLSAALWDAITIKNGQVEQTNFPAYPMVRMDGMPKVEVYILPSGEAVGGIGEPGVPPIAPAVVNAVFAVTGKRIRRLPIRPQDLRKG